MAVYEPVKPGPAYGKANQPKAGVDPRLEAMREAQNQQDKAQLAAGNAASFTAANNRTYGPPQSGEMTDAQKIILSTQAQQALAGTHAYYDTQRQQAASQEAARQQSQQNFETAHYGDQRSELEGQRQSAIQTERDARLFEQQRQHANEAAWYQADRDYQQNQYQQQQQQQHGEIQGQLQQQHGGIQQQLQSEHGDIQANLMQTQLTLSEQQRMQRLREGIAAIQADPQLPESARRDLYTQLVSGLSPLQARHREAQLLTERLHQDQMSQNNQQQATLFQQRQAYLSRSAQDRIIQIRDPSTGQMTWHYTDEHGNPQPFDFGQAREAQRLANELTTNQVARVPIANQMQDAHLAVAQNQVTQLPIANQLQQVQLDLERGRIPLQVAQAEQLRLHNLQATHDTSPEMLALRRRQLAGTISQQEVATTHHRLEAERLNQSLNQGLSPQQQATARNHVSTQLSRDPGWGALTQEQQSQRIEQRFQEMYGPLIHGGNRPSQERWNLNHEHHRNAVGDLIEAGVMAVPAGQNREQFVNQHAERLTRQNLGMPQVPQAIDLMDNPQTDDHRTMRNALHLDRAAVTQHSNVGTPETRRQYLANHDRVVELLNRHGGNIDAMNPRDLAEYTRLRAAMNQFFGRPQQGQAAVGQPGQQAVGQAGANTVATPQEGLQASGAPNWAMPGGGSSLRHHLTPRLTNAYAATTDRLGRQGYHPEVAGIIADAHHGIGSPLLPVPSFAARGQGGSRREADAIVNNSTAYDVQFDRLLDHGMTPQQARLTLDAHYHLP